MVDLVPQIEVKSMAKNLSTAIDEVETTYEQIEQIANDIIREPLDLVNQLVIEIQNNVSVMSTDLLRDYMMRLQTALFQISEIRDKAAAKAQCAEALRKEAYSTSFLQQEGTAGQKDANATIAISDRIVTEYLYELVSNLVKTKIDQGLRLIDTLKSVLMSRMQEAKINNLVE